MKYPIYMKDEKKVPKGLYLGLFHGFKNQKEREKTDDWGEQGALIGPLEYVHTTYSYHIKFNFESESDAKKYGFTDRRGDLPVKEDCILFDGMEYGDWTVFNVK